MIKHKGVRIVAVKITRYEVRDPTGHVMHKTSDTGKARAWINGYLAMADRAAKAAAAEAPKPKRVRKPKTTLSGELAKLMPRVQ